MSRLFIRTTTTYVQRNTNAKAESTLLLYFKIAFAVCHKEFELFVAISNLSFIVGSVTVTLSPSVVSP